MIYLILVITISNQLPETLIGEKSTGDENCGTNAEKYDVQQNLSFLAANKELKQKQ